MNDVLDFGGHFLSLGRDRFCKRGGFSTATPVYVKFTGARASRGIMLVTLSKVAAPKYQDQEPRGEAGSLFSLSLRS